MSFRTILPLCALACSALAAPGSAQCFTRRASTDAAALEADLGSGLGSAAWSRRMLSADGRYLAFWSAATNLVPNDTNGATDVFVKDLASGAIERVSVDSAGLEAHGESIDPAISADGRFVAFQSTAPDLVAFDSNDVTDVFVHDRLLGTTVRASVDSIGVEGDGDSTRADLSADGNLVAFQSVATNLVPLDGNGFPDVFVRDLALATTICASVDPLGDVGDEFSGAPSLSGNGRWIAFHSWASTLVAADVNGFFDVFVRDLQTGVTERASVPHDGAPADDLSQTPSISADGRYVAFSSLATNLVLNDWNNVMDVFVRDRTLGTTTRVSVATGGGQANSGSQGNAITADGRFVIFQSQASNLVPSDTNGGMLQLDHDVFVRDRATGSTTRLSVDDVGGQADAGSSLYASVAADASRVAFASDAVDLESGDANGVRDWFTRTCGGPPPPTTFCAGDGTSIACPCGNVGTSGRGCNNSMATGGARLSISGKASVSDDQIVLLLIGIGNAAPGLFFQGDAEVGGGFGSHFGDGVRCAGGDVRRLGTRFANGGAIAFGYGVSGDPALSTVGAVPASGGVRTYQIWYRNVVSFCTPEGFNLSNGVRVTWTP